jgi:hypothetical protein
MNPLRRSRDPSEIANFHQRAFDSHLQGTALDVHIEEIRLVAPGVWLACTKGGIIKANGSVVERTGESVQLFVFREQAGLVAIEAFQNARLRPVADAHFEKAAGGPNLSNSRFYRETIGRAIRSQSCGKQLN